MKTRLCLIIVVALAGTTAWAGYGTDLASINAHLESELDDAKKDLADAKAKRDPSAAAETHKNAARTLVDAHKLAMTDGRKGTGTAKEKAKLKQLEAAIGTLKDAAVTELFPLWERKIDAITGDKSSWTQTFLTDLIGIVPATDKRLAALAKRKGCRIDVKANVAECP